MSGVDGHDRARVVEYVERALRLDPLQQAQEIVASRSAALGRTTGSGVASFADIERGRQQRRQALETLERVRAEYWTMPLEELQSVLAGLSALPYEDLREPATRLEQVATEREAILGLKSELGFAPIVFELLEQILTRPRRETATAREQLREALALPQHRRKRRVLVEQLRQRAPKSYPLERELFDSLLKSYRRRGLPKLVESSDSRSEATASRSTWAYWLVGFAALQLLRAIFGGQ